MTPSDFRTYRAVIPSRHGGENEFANLLIRETISLSAMAKLIAHRTSIAGAGQLHGETHQKFLCRSADL